MRLIQISAPTDDDTVFFHPSLHLRELHPKTIIDPSARSGPTFLIGITVNGSATHLRSS